MNFKSAFCFLSCCVLSTVSLTGIMPQVKAQQEVSFICADGIDPQDQKVYPTTYALTDRGKIPVVRWHYKWFGDNAVVLKGRCQTVSSAFQAAYNNGNLNYITNSTMAKQPVICATDSFLGSCSTVLLALRSSEDPLKTLTQLQQVLNGQRVVPPSPRFVAGERIYISVDMNQLLATAPVQQE